MKVLLVGQAPGRDGRNDDPLSGPGGRRLARLASLDHADYLARFCRANLLGYYPGSDGAGDKFPAKEARAAAARFDPGEADLVLLLGAGVARAFGLGDRPLLAWFPWRGRLAARLPHPSGRCRWWNDAENKKRAGAFLKVLAHHATAEGA